MSSEGRLPGFDGATGWLNSPPLTAADVGGKVVLVDFWTYTCINWLRTLSYVRAWAEKYHDRGLVTVGVRLGPEAGEWMQHATLAIRARVPLEVLRDTIQPFPSFSEIHAAALKALRQEIGAARRKVGVGAR